MHFQSSFSLCLLLLIKIFLLSSSPTSALDFIFNGFNSSDLLFFGGSSVESNIVSLTNDSTFNLGRVLYPTKIPTRHKNSSHLLPFSTSFIFSIAPFKDLSPGHGLVFLLAPSTGIQGTSSSQHLGLLNRTNNGDSNNHVFGVEFDVFENPEFNDINNNHVGVNVNSLTSFTSRKAGYWREVNPKVEDSFQELKLIDGVNYHVWVDYFEAQLNVTIAPVGLKRPWKPLISVPLNLSEVLLDEMYAGFCASTGQLVESHRILAWSFSNSNISASLSTSNLPSFVREKGSVFHSKRFVAGFLVAIVVLVACAVVIYLDVAKRKERKMRDVEATEDWELDYWPHKIPYKEIYNATNGFSKENVIGVGGNGRVYKGVMAGEVKVAVKCISQETKEGLNEFLSEISSLGRLRHRNLVGLRGWCKREKDGLLLVYDLMENGSLDKMLFDCKDTSRLLSWEERIRVLKDVGVGVMYLHEGWESRIIHRDIKASNVLLDQDMNGRIGDFGLARIHGNVIHSTRVVGTAGYMAPELVVNGRATVQTDVFSYGVLVLEVVCGKRAMESGGRHLVDWVWSLVEQGEFVNVLDERLRAKGGINYAEAERVVRFGLLCTHPNPAERITMRKMVIMLEETMDGNKSEGLLQMEDSFETIKSTAMWSSYRPRVHQTNHPTFQELQGLLSSSSMSLSESDIVVEGR